MLPFTAITGELVIDQTWGKNAYAYTTVEFNDPTVGMFIFAPFPETRSVHGVSYIKNALT
jgi:hypothetical protein